VQTLAGFDTLQLALEGPVLTIALHRPERMNAYTHDMSVELMRAFDLADADDAVRAVIVTGSGRAFCAGADLSLGAKTFDYAARGDRPGAAAAAGAAAQADGGGIDWGSEAVRDSGGRVTLRIFGCLKPVIAAVNGPAVGIGATMLLPMDIRLAAEGARFGFVFTRRGIVPEACSSWFLPRLVGISQALEWTMTGRVLDAAEALRGGLVRQVLPPAELLPAAHALALEIAANTAPVSVALTRQLMLRMQGAAHPMEAHRIDSRAIFSRGASADAKEGVESFLDKRAAVFPNTVSADMPPWFPWWDEPGYE
jgi:enoyl-CoA hydratase/carnithine racemase